ncbi:MAG TPA: YceH family protein [Geobacteraceae bacterium]
MKMNLDEVEIRILGCLIEKELTTPENYPLSLNALTSACNQKSNRAPVMDLAEADVVRGLDKLGARGLARLTAAGGRVPKYRHSCDDNLQLPPPALAVLAELMLRGPQTAGELRNRAERMTPLADIAAVEDILGTLLAFGPPLVTRLPRQPGHKEQRYAQLFAGVPDVPADALVPPPEPARQRVMAENERLARLDEEVSTLRAEIAHLRRAIEELRALFA